MAIVLGIFILLSVLLEGIVTTLPLTIVGLICFTVMRRDTSVFLPAFLAGLAIDIFRVEHVGMTSIFYIIFLFLILLYKKKYEIYSSPFILMATFFGTFFFLLIFKSEGIMIQSIVNAILAVVLFTILRYFNDAKLHKQNTKFLTV